MPTKISMLTKPPSSRSRNDDRPQVDEDHLDVEGHEQQGVDVERQAEPAVGVAVGVDAATRRAGPCGRRRDCGARPATPRRSSGRRTTRPAKAKPDDVPDAGQSNSLRATRRRTAADGTGTASAEPPRTLILAAGTVANGRRNGCGVVDAGAAGSRASRRGGPRRTGRSRPPGACRGRSRHRGGERTRRARVQVRAPLPGGAVVRRPRQPDADGAERQYGIRPSRRSTRTCAQRRDAAGR